mmetsp:Transcript_25787/g.38603  ORF Transcript_25787/g.38603 Transcript_25787/m.38603 type:complete len:284 (-) Transcript_25787:461-1312(-)
MLSISALLLLLLLFFLATLSPPPLAPSSPSLLPIPPVVKTSDNASSESFALVIFLQSKYGSRGNVPILQRAENSLMFVTLHPSLSSTISSSFFPCPFEFTEENMEEDDDDEDCLEETSCIHFVRDILICNPSIVLRPYSTTPTHPIIFLVCTAFAPAVVLLLLFSNNFPLDACMKIDLFFANTTKSFDMNDVVDLLLLCCCCCCPCGFCRIMVIFGLLLPTSFVCGVANIGIRLIAELLLLLFLPPLPFPLLLPLPLQRGTSLKASESICAFASSRHNGVHKF